MPDVAPVLALSCTVARRSIWPPDGAVALSCAIVGAATIIDDDNNSATSRAAVTRLETRLTWKFFIRNDLVHGRCRRRNFPRRKREQSRSDKAGDDNQHYTHTIHLCSAIPFDAKPDRAL